MTPFTGRRFTARARGTLLALAALAIVGCAAHTLPPIENADTLATARQLIDRRDFTSAIEMLRGYVDRNTGREDVDAAIYLLGEAHLKAKEPALAQVEFERLLRDYPESDSNAAASFQLGAALEAQSRSEDFDQEFTMRALDQYERYQREYPSHSKIAEAQAKVASLRSKLARKLTNTGNLYIRLRQPEAARAYFQRVKDDFSDTPLLGDAEIGLAWSDAVAGKKAEAVAALKDLESRFTGQPLAHKAAAERRKIEKFRPPEKKGLPRGTPEGPPTP
jgi:outer membrane protein assembly factor BamD